MIPSTSLSLSSCAASITSGRAPSDYFKKVKMPDDIIREVMLRLPLKGLESFATAYPEFKRHRNYAIVEKFNTKTMDFECTQLSENVLKLLDSLGTEDSSRIKRLVMHGGALLKDDLSKLHELSPNLMTLDVIKCKLDNEGLIILNRFTKLQELNFKSCWGYEPRMFDQISQLTALQKMALYSGGCNDEGLAHLAKFAPLRDLDLQGCSGVTKKGLNELTALTSLTRLNLGWCKNVDGEGLKKLASLSRLGNLSLCYCRQLVQTDIVALSLLTQLTELDLSGCPKVDDSCMTSLAKLTSLKKLKLDCCKKITSAAFRNLSSLPDLAYLSIILCGPFEEDDLIQLTLFSNLRIVQLDRRYTTKEGRQALRRLMPSLVIIVS